MIHSEKEYKMLEEQLRKLKKDNELKDKENKLLRVQNNRVKSERKPGREKGHKKSAPTVSANPDNVKGIVNYDETIKAL